MKLWYQFQYPNFWTKQSKRITKVKLWYKLLTFTIEGLDKNQKGKYVNDGRWNWHINVKQNINKIDLKIWHVIFSKVVVTQMTIIVKYREISVREYVYIDLTTTTLLVGKGICEYLFLYCFKIQPNFDTHIWRDGSRKILFALFTWK